MGYSCNAISSLVEDALIKILQAAGHTDGTSNGWARNGERYFYERGREQDDGAITGTVWKHVGEFCRRVGSFRIGPGGHVARFPTSTKDERAQAFVDGLEEYKRIYKSYPIGA